MMLVCLCALLSVSTLPLSAQTRVAEGWFRYTPFGHSLLADVHPDLVRMDIAANTNHPTYDYTQGGKQYRTTTLTMFGLSLPIWTGQVVDERFYLNVKMTLSASLWMDLFESTTSPITNTDFRVSLPTWTFMHQCRLGFMKNYSVAWSPFKHESTHIGDELLLQHVDQGYPLRRVNVSYNYTELQFTVNETADRYSSNHCLRAGVMILLSPKRGWYFIEQRDGDESLAQPRLSPWEAYVQYQYQSDTSPHGFQAVVSAELRNRAIYGYPVFSFDGQTLSSKEQKEKRRFTYNIFAGVRYNTPNYDGYFSRFAFGIRAYHGNCPHGQFRNIDNFSQIGACLIFE